MNACIFSAELDPSAPVVEFREKGIPLSDWVFPN